MVMGVYAATAVVHRMSATATTGLIPSNATIAMEQAMPTTEPPRVWNCRKDAPEHPRDAAYVGRGSKWGNPYHAGSRQENIDRYRTLVLSQPAMIQHIKQELRGKHLLCWCTPKPCHADVLLEIANGD
jgi:hypothetical protein